ncbi:MAG: DUF896 domain-containing protein [Clostridiales bacterium]|nr:DUF896 domain-containing protein [Clostridiales bacterium]
MKQEQIARISALTRIARERPLTPAEAEEREALRAEYRAAVRRSLEAQLDNTYVAEPDGTKRKLKKAP